MVRYGDAWGNIGKYGKHREIWGGFGVKAELFSTARAQLGFAGHTTWHICRKYE